MERQKPLDRVFSFQTQNAEIPETPPPRLPAHFANPAQKPLDAKKVPLDVMPSHGEQKGAVAAAEIYLEGRRSCEQLFGA
jgi:hypothetical protein